MKRPVIILGHGVRLAGAAHLVRDVLDYGVPVLTSWPAADLVDSDHPNYFGRPGAYGQRCANKVLYEADYILAIGCRLSLLTVGYAFQRDGQHVDMVDIDGTETRRFASRWIAQDARAFIEETFGPGRGGYPEWRVEDCADWLASCRAWRAQYPWLESPHHDHTRRYINPHRFISELQAYLTQDEVIVADCCSGSLAAHQILRLKPPQRLMISAGLGEMGSGLPAAIGAAFATGKRVICLNTDGGMMLNVQELQTIAHYNLPIKIIVFSNDGYGMIRDTQRNFGMRHSGVDRASGVSCPDFGVLADAFEIMSDRVAQSSEIAPALRWLLQDSHGPALLEVHIDPNYLWGPKLRPGRNADGSIKHAVFSEMSP